MKRSLWWLVGAVGFGLVLVLSIRACQTSSVVQTPSETAADVIPGLTLKDVTLEQQDESGQLIWRVNAAEVTYTPDQETAQLVNLDGELYQDGAVLYRVTSDRGIIENNGERILLEGNIVATGTKNKMVLRGQNLVWTPADAVLVVRNGITGTHPQVRAQANEARVYDRESRMELEGDVVATTVVADPKTKPWLKLQSQTLDWQWEDETFNSDQPLRVERFQDETVTQVLIGAKGLVELAENRVTLTEAVQAQLLEIPLQMNSQRAVWEVEAQTIEAETNVRVINPQEQIVVTAQNSEFDLAENIAVFTNDVLATEQQNTGRLRSDRLQWNLADQTVLAEGNVVYEQSDPTVQTRGPRARGRIEDQTVLMEGGGGQVVTEIEPPFN
jgi:LPS export ABC transporter protein LptC